MAVGAAKHMWRCEEACAADAAVADCAASAAVPTHAARRTRARRNRHSTAAGAFIAEADLRGGGREGGREEEKRTRTRTYPDVAADAEVLLPLREEGVGLLFFAALGSGCRLLHHGVRYCRNELWATDSQS